MTSTFPDSRPSTELASCLLARRLQSRALELLEAHPALAAAIASGEALLEIAPATVDKAKVEAIMIPHRLRMSPQGRHFGKEAMSAIIQAADELGCSLELLARPLPMQPEPGGPSTLIPLDKLARFYGDFGFVEVPGSRSAHSAKMRRPSTARPVLGAQNRQP